MTTLRIRGSVFAFMYIPLSNLLLSWYRVAPAVHIQNMAHRFLAVSAWGAVFLYIVLRFTLWESLYHMWQLQSNSEMGLCWQGL